MIHTPDSSLPPSAQSWIANHRAERLSATVSSLFNDYVHSLPWAGTTGLDWSRMPSCSSIDSSNASDAELDRWMRGTRLSRSTHAALWYSLESGGIVTPTTAVIGSLDELFQYSAGVRFVFAMDALRGVPDFAGLLQWGLGDRVFATTH